MYVNNNINNGEYKSSKDLLHLCRTQNIPNDNRYIVENNNYLNGKQESMLVYENENDISSDSSYSDNDNINNNNNNNNNNDNNNSNNEANNIKPD